MKKFFLTLAVALAAVTMWAVPAMPRLYTFTQSDGTTISVSRVGDEWHSSYVTTDGMTVARDAQGDFYYRDVNGLTSMMAHNPEERSASETQFVNTRSGDLTLASQFTDQKAQRRQNAFAAPAQAGPRKVGQAVKPTGTQYIPVILVSYADVDFKDSDPVSTFTSFFSSGSTSVEQYFKDQSENQFDPRFDILGHVSLTQPRAYYGAHSDTWGNDSRVGTMVAQACEGITGVDWTKYDNNNDGTIDAVIVIFAGVGEASSSVDDAVWPCRWQIYGSDYGYKYVYVPAGSGTKKVNAFGVFNELNGSNTSRIDGIGTVCHEFSHVLGLPDYYDVNYSGNFGMGDWSLMDGGCYNNSGYTPCAYGQYEKSFMGWKSLETAVPGTTYRLDATSLSSGKGIKVPSPNNTNEYYILENIQKTGWNAYAHNSGLLVTHVYYNSTAWNNNTVNTTSTRRMTIIPADNTLKMVYSSGYYYADSNNQNGDLYPYSGNNELTDTSTPAAEIYTSPNLMGKPITKITKNSDGTVSFVYVASAAEMGDTPTLTVNDSEIEETAFTARWDEQSGAESYNLRVNPFATVMRETFPNAVAESASGITGSLTAYTDNSGWMAYRVYAVEGGMRLGYSGATGTLGYIYNTSIDTQASGGRGVVKVTAYGVDANNTSMTVSLAGKSETVTITKQPATYTIVLDDIEIGAGKELRIANVTRGQRVVVTNVELLAPTTITVDAMTETFAPCTETVETVINGSLTGYTDNAGWMSYRVRKVAGGLRLGNSGTNGAVGYIYNKTFDTSASGGKAVVKINAYGIDADATDMRVTFAGKADTVSVSKTDAVYTIEFNGISEAEAQQLYISGVAKGNRLVVTNIVVQYEQSERTITGLPGSSYQVTGLTPDSYYLVDIQAEYTPGPSDWSNKVLVHTLADASAPVAPVALEATDVDYYSFIANWQAVDGATSYTLTVNGPDSEPMVFDGLTETSYSLTDLQPGTQYTYYVTAVNEIGASEKSNVITVTTVAEPQYISGDANLDGLVNVVDVVSTALFTLERTTGTFWFKAADINGDGTIDVTDIVGIVNISLGLDASPAAAPLFVIPDGNASLDIAAFNLKAGESRDIAILLDNDGDYTALQFDMTLPQGVTASDAMITSRSVNHTADMATLVSGSDRLILYSVENDVIAGSNGAVVMLTLTADETFSGQGTLTLDNIILADARMHRYSLAPVTVMIGAGTTDVDNMRSENVVITTEGGLLSVDTPVARQVVVTTVNGQSIVLNAKAGHNIFFLPAQAIYIVKVADQVVKVRL